MSFRVLALLILSCVSLVAVDRQTINVGTLPNDNTGDSLRTAMQKINANFAALWPSGTNTGTVLSQLGALPKVDSFLQLRSLGASMRTNAALVLGANGANDGGGGVFYWQPESTTADDGGICIAPADGEDGRWVRVYTGPVNPKWFGATGDSDTDDTTALINTCTEAHSSGNIIQFPAGTYRLLSPLYFTNVGGILGVPGKTVLKPEGFDGAAIVLITTNATAQNYSWPTYVSGLTILGDNNPDGDGINIGTNYLTGGNYTANVYLDNVVVRGFTNGNGLVIGNALACEIAGCSFESNYTGVAISSETGVTTTRFHDSQLRRNIYGWQSTNSALYFGPNNIVEGNYRDAMLVGLAPYNFFQCVGNWFEDNHYFALLDAENDPPTNHYAITIYGSGSINLATFRDGHFNTGAGQPLPVRATNVSQVIWDGVSVATVITNMVKVSGSSHLLVSGAQQYQDGTLMFHVDDPATASYNYAQFDPAQFTFDGYYNRIKNFRATSTENIWTNEIRVLNDGTAAPGLVLQDTASSGHTFWLHDRVAAAGNFGLYDETAALYRWIAKSTGEFEIKGGATVTGDGTLISALTLTDTAASGHTFSLNTRAGGVAGKFGLFDATGARYLFTADASTGQLSIPAGFVTGTDAQVVGTLTANFVKPSNVGASKLVQTDGVGVAVGIANGAGALINDGSGAFSWQSGITVTNSWSDGGGTNWTMVITKGLVTSMTHTP